MLFKALLLILLFRFCESRDTITWNQEQLKDDGGVLVSKQSKFELGFFSPGNSSYRYGELDLYAYNMESTPIWSSNVSRSVQNVNTSTLSAQLLDTGNLVVFQDDNNENFLWQSFDHPTDTLIPGMKVGMNWKTGREWVLTSWKSQDDPGTGDYTLRLYPNQIASPQFFMYKGSSKYWRSDPGTTGLVTNQEETYYPMNNTNAITRATVIDSAVEGFTWDDGGLQWKVGFSAPKSRCDWYGECGANSKCLPDNVIMFWCDCLPGYVPNSISDWNHKNGSGGCVSNRLGLLKCGDGDGFVKVARVKYPDTSIGALSKSGMSAKECEQECLRNCSCTAYLSTENEGPVDCLTWYDDLMDIKMYTEIGQDLYVRVNATVLAANARRSEGFLERRRMLAIPILSAVLALVLIIMLACWWRKKNRNTKDFVEAEELVEKQRHPELQFFDLDTIVAATDHFSRVNELGHGGFGSVYKGQLPNEQKVAVKRLSQTSGQGIEEFKNEVALIARLQHRNLVKLLGCCIKGEERMLVLEYMPNKSLNSFLFDNTRRSFLDWEKRFEIINGIARGILYLHQDSRLRIIHRDLKTSNILLDAEMNPKISDFGMARIFHRDQLQDKTSRIVGTYGYMSPEYAVFGRFSMKSDVFSFGIIMLEIVSGRKNNDSDLEDPSMNLIGRVWELWGKGRALDIVDSTLKSYQPNEVMRCIQVALLCVQEDSKDRPAMSAIVFMLSGESSPPLPKHPAFVYRRDSGIDVDPLLPNRSYSINDLTITTMEAR
ncbi:G-type lectin S-receptor-like serine/threonine-protein kinase RKS1 isoform X2 [Rosa chinensis]|uniref:G-type lectin S-receptor-like serine/threonine-protein kinase RKS1 isoform X2 n=1 Tax=Rosa chinensis TaxID=74649 RepID=UPI001AD90C2B|nr:G-type lectin S-receptor-like serine/threonine-protein kinase RKS1 isoform X2 [Rosa chinensis]